MAEPVRTSTRSPQQVDLNINSKTQDTTYKTSLKSLATAGLIGAAAMSTILSRPELTQLKNHTKEAAYGLGALAFELHTGALLTRAAYKTAKLGLKTTYKIGEKTFKTAKFLIHDHPGVTTGALVVVGVIGSFYQYALNDESKKAIAEELLKNKKLAINVVSEKTQELTHAITEFAKSKLNIGR